MSQDVAIAHGKLTGDGGAQRVAIELARTFDAPIYALQVDQEFVPADVEAHQLVDGRLGCFFTRPRDDPGLLYWLSKHLYTLQRNTWFGPLHDFDTIIQSKPEMGWFIQRDEHTIVRYVHHCYRRHYSQFYRMGRAAKKRLWSLGFRALTHHSNDYPHLLVCNSETTAQRMRDQFAIEDDRLRVCYPPVNVSGFGPEYATAEYDDCYVTVGRLAGNKHLDEVVAAFQDREESLLIAGDGPERDALERLADGHENIQLLGYISEPNKRELLASAKAFVMNARYEDFGIAPIEAFASGTPVLGVAEPYTKHQIIDGANGYVYERGGIETAIDRLETNNVTWGTDRIVRFAERFSVDRFREAMRAHVTDAKARAATPRPPWQQPDEQAEPVVEVEVEHDG